MIKILTATWNACYVTTSTLRDVDQYRNYERSDARNDFKQQHARIVLRTCARGMTARRCARRVGRYDAALCHFTTSGSNCLASQPFATLKPLSIPPRCTIVFHHPRNYSIFWKTFKATLYAEGRRISNTNAAFLQIRAYGAMQVRIIENPIPLLPPSKILHVKRIMT